LATYDEDAQIETLRRWWDDNWKALVAGLVIGLAGIFGWQMWHRHQVAHQLQAATLYQDMTQAMTGKKDADVKAIVERLKKDFDNTPYAAQAELKLAQTDVAYGRFDSAADHLQWVVDHADDDGIRAIARLRLAAVQWQLGKDDDALKLLQQPPKTYIALYGELRGDILMDRKKTTEARSAYQQALAALPADSIDRGALQHKLDNLAGVAAGQS